MRLHKRDKMWQATIRIGSKHKQLGYFKTELAANKAYKKALKELL